MSLDALIAVQYGIVRRDQLLRAGLGPGTIRRRVASGEWQRVFATIYALFAEPLDTQRRQVAGWLYAGPDAQLAGPTAAYLHGLRNVPLDPAVHVLIPHYRQLAEAGFVTVHRTVRMEAPCRVEPVTVCSVARAVADTARWCPDRPMIRALVSEAVECGRTTLAALHAESSAGRRNGSALLRLTLNELSAGAAHQPEQELRTALMQSRELPRIAWNPQLVGPDGQGLPWVDGWIDEAGIGLEVDSHGDRTPDDWEHAARRHALLAEYGVLVLQFPPTRIRQDPGGVRATVERAYRQRRTIWTGTRVSMVREGAP